MYRERGECRRQTASGATDGVREKSRVTGWKRRQVRRTQAGSCVAQHCKYHGTRSGERGARRTETDDSTETKHRIGEVRKRRSDYPWESNRVHLLRSVSDSPSPPCDCLRWPGNGNELGAISADWLTGKGAGGEVESAVAPVRDDCLVGVPGTWWSFDPAEEGFLERTLPCAEPPPSTPFLGLSACTLVGWQLLLIASCLCWHYTPTRRRQTCTAHRIWVPPAVSILGALAGFRFRR